MAEVKYLKSKSKNNYVVEEKSDTRTRSDNSDTTIFELKNQCFSMPWKCYTASILYISGIILN